MIFTKLLGTECERVYSGSCAWRVLCWVRLEYWRWWCWCLALSPSYSSWDVSFEFKLEDAPCRKRARRNAAGSEAADLNLDGLEEVLAEGEEGGGPEPADGARIRSLRVGISNTQDNVCT